MASAQSGAKREQREGFLAVETAFDLAKDAFQVHLLSTGCPILDGFLRGGIPLQGITEIAGEAGAGKTQICLQLLFQALLPTDKGGLSGEALFLSTEGEIPVRRLQQLAEKYQKLHFPHLSVSDLLNKICVESVHTIDQQFEVLLTRIPSNLRVRNFRLVIIDSIAALFRGEYSNSRTDLISRANIVIKFAAQMKKLNDKMGIAFVVTNQVSDVLRAPSIQTSLEDPFQTRNVTPYMGLAWSNCVNTRFLVCRTQVQYSHSKFSGSHDCDAQISKAESSPIRLMRVLLASHLPTWNQPCDPEAMFIITNQGVQGVSKETSIECIGRKESEANEGNEMKQLDLRCIDQLSTESTESQESKRVELTCWDIERRKKRKSPSSCLEYEIGLL